MQGHRPTEILSNIRVNVKERKQVGKVNREIVRRKGQFKKKAQKVTLRREESYREVVEKNSSLSLSLSLTHTLSLSLSLSLSLLLRAYIISLYSIIEIADVFQLPV